MKLSKIQKKVIKQIVTGWLPVNSLLPGYHAAQKLVKAGYLEISSQNNFQFTEKTEELLSQVYS